MNRYKTPAFEVKSEIDEIIPDLSITDKHWKLLGCNLISRTLQTTATEVEHLLNLKAHERIGFDIEKNSVFVPNLFVKFSGAHDFTSHINDINDSACLKHVILYNSINEFSNTSGTVQTDLSQLAGLLDSDGLLIKSKVLNSPLSKYGYLKIEYQDLIIDKINYIVSERQKIFINGKDTLSTEDIIMTLLNLDNKIINMFNSFDFQYSVPKIIIRNEDKSIFSIQQAYVLALLNQLAFDIIIISENGYADVENYINLSNYCVYYNEIKNDIKTKLPPKRKNWIKAAAVILAGFIIIGAGYASYNVFKSGFSQAPIVEIKKEAISPPAAEIKTTPVPVKENARNPSSPTMLKILSVTPNSALKSGFETTFKVEVSYTLQNYDKAVLVVGANDGVHDIGRSFRFNVPSEQVTTADIYHYKNYTEISKGKNNVIVEIKAIPQKWEANPFGIAVMIKPTLEETIALSKDRINLSIQK